MRNTELENRAEVVCAQTYEEMMDGVVLAFNRLYISERSRFVIMSQDKGAYIPKNNGKTLYLSDKHIEAHVQRKYAIAIYSGSGSKFVCFDVDDGSKDTVRRLIDGIETFGIPREYAYVSFSGRKGYHVEVFFDGLVAVEKLKQFYGHICAQCGLDMRKVEYRPDTKHAIKLPLSIHHETKKPCWFVDRDTLEPMQSYDPLYDIRQVNTESFLALVSAQVSAVTVPAARNDDHQPLDVAHDEKVMRALCNASDIQLSESGTRHNTMLRIAVCLRYKGVKKEECLKQLISWVKEQNPNLYRSSEDEAGNDAAHITDWVYGAGFTERSATQPAQIPVIKREMKRVMEQSTRITRKLFFIFLVNDKANTPKVSLERLSDMLGVSVSTVRRNINTLKWSGEIIVKQPRRKVVNGKYCTTPNLYSIPRKGGNLEGEARKGLQERRVEVPLYGMWECFDNAYYAALEQTFTTRELLSFLDSKELDEYKRYLSSTQVVS